MKAILASLVLACSLSVYADEPGPGYPQNQPPPLEDLEPDQGQPCVAPCVPQQPACVSGYACGGGYYGQVPQKVCQFVRVAATRWGADWIIVRFGQRLTGHPKPLPQIQMDAVHYQRLIEADGRPVCEVVL